MGFVFARESNGRVGKDVFGVLDEMRVIACVKKIQL
jgi:hypothetical protein